MGDRELHEVLHAASAGRTHDAVARIGESGTAEVLYKVAQANGERKGITYGTGRQPK